MSPFKADIIFLDTGAYAEEGATSGVLIFLQRMLKKFESHGKKIGIVTYGNFKKLNVPAIQPGLRKRIDNGIQVYELALDDQEMASEKNRLYRVEKLLRDVQPSVIIMTTPAVFLTPIDVTVRKLANQHSKLVIHVLADELFPQKKSHDTSLVDELYEQIGLGEVIGVTERIRSEFKKETNINAIPFKTLINSEELLIDECETNSTCIGMVNIHPIKGIEIFDQVATKMPELEFLVVKNWPDTPNYHPSSDNVSVLNFIEDVKEFYKKIQVLMIPSLIQEGPTMVMMEALVNGIPVIANRIGSLPEVGSEAVVYIDPPDIIRYDFEGSVMIPVCDPNAISNVSNLYVNEIRRAIAEASPSKRSWLREIANKDISKGHEIMNNLVSGWLKHI